ncbi:MAG: hypothetical protein E7054_07160 [Lentisphaerae bacterium]|nr:hypothetical protein [Lentisphaerota bacterium]
MTKEELTTKIGELTAENDTLRSDKQILEGDLLEARADLAAAKKELETLKNADPKTASEDSGTIAALREIIDLSCKDHCPHRGKVEACKNCTIYLKLQEIDR